MPAAANADLFDQAHWRVIARGFDTEHWFNDGQAVGTGGIVNPEPTTLRTGQYYYRFANSSASRESRFGGGWWMDFENYKLIETFASTNGYTLRDAARLMLALPHAWTRVDQIVRAFLRQPLRAYTGQGKPAQGAAKGADHGTRWIPTQHIKVRQLYIPGLYIKGRKEQLFETVFEQPVDVMPLT